MKSSHHMHSHSWLIGVGGLALGLVLLLRFPSLKAVAGVILLVALFHLIGGVVLLASIYSLAPHKFANAFKKLRPTTSKSSGEIDYGWSWGWMNGLWIAALGTAGVALGLQLQYPAWWPAWLTVALLAVNFFVGNILMRTSKKRDWAALPLVDLLSSDHDQVLDAGCGAGRTSIVLSKVIKNGKIVAFDRFDADYIEAGGRALLEKNLRIAGIADQVRIEKGNITEMPFSEATFDAAVSAHVIDHLGPDKALGLKEIRRVLKPGSRFLLMVWVPGYTMFAIANVFSLLLTSKTAWRAMAREEGFVLKDEGTLNGAWFLLLEKSR